MNPGTRHGSSVTKLVKTTKHSTWSHSDRAPTLPHIHRINLQIPKIREIHHTAIRDRGSTTVLLHTRSRVPSRSKKVFTFARVDDHASTTFTGTSFDVVDGGCDGVDEDGCDPDRLSGS